MRFRRDGRSIWKSFKTKEEAERFLAEARLRWALRQPEPVAVRKRFSDFAQAWLEHMKAHVSSKTWEGYAGALRVHLVPEFGSRLLTEITALSWTPPCSRANGERRSTGGTFPGMFTATVRRAKLGHVRFYDLRHSFVSLLVLQGAHPTYISEQLGHASTQITMDRYSHLFDTSYADESEKLEAALFGETSINANALTDAR